MEEPMDLFNYLSEHKVWTVIIMVWSFACCSIRININQLIKRGDVDFGS